MVKVLVVDDSTFFRKRLTEIVNKDKDLELVAQDDEFGRRIQDMNLVTPKRAKRK